MTGDKILELFDLFLKNYPEEEKNEIWKTHQSDFKEFWVSKIIKPNDAELYDQEIDDIVRILDVHGKGNTKHSEAVARVMIPQGAWRRLFNQLKEEHQLSNSIDSILNNQNDEGRANQIDVLYQLNGKNKNNLTGKSGTAINCLLAAHDPFNNLSIVSINDRVKLLTFLGVNYNPNQDSIGQQIERTSRLIKSKFEELNIKRNARTLSAFVYSSVFADYWKSRDSVELTEAVVPLIPEIDHEISSEDFMFYMEKQLEDFLIENWDKTQLGKKYDLITNDDGLASQQYRTDIGIIDILAKDKKDGRFVVIELKRNQTSDDTIGQIARYMGWVEEHLSHGNPCKGIIIAGKYDKKLKYAIKKISDIEVYLYKVDFQLTEYNG